MFSGHSNRTTLRTMQVFAFGACLCFSTTTCAQTNLVDNGDFDLWTDGSPDGWKVEIGAMNGADAPVSEVKRIDGPALMLRGTARTLAWRTVSQPIDVQPQQAIHLKFTARCKDVQREGRQHDNCHVGLISKDKNGKLLGRAIQDISNATGDWKEFTVEYSVPQNAHETVVYVFLSKTGLIGVKGVIAASSAPKDLPEGGAEDNLINNGQLGNWTNGVPKSWTSEIAAQNGGNTPESQLKPIGKTGVELTGNAQTLAWRSLGQNVVLEPRKTYSLSFDAIAQRVIRQGRQYDNCYVGVMHFDKEGKRLDMAIQDLSKTNRRKRSAIRFNVPDGTAKSTVLVFLSKSGSLKINDVVLREAPPQKPFR